MTSNQFVKLSCKTNDDLLAMLSAGGRPYEVLARTVYGLEIVCVQLGGKKQPPIVITAGAHAGEPAGVLAALALIENLQTEHAVYVVPLRDPFAWGGFARCLSYSIGQEVKVTTHADAEQLLSNHGTIIYQETEDNLLISLVGDLVFVTMHPSEDTAGPREIERRLNRTLHDHPALVTALAGKRACWPTNLDGIEGCGLFERAFSAIITPHGLVADFNRQFTYAYPPVEVQCVRDLVDRVRPALILDLHEGQGSKFYLWTNHYEHGSLTARIASAILEEIALNHGELYRLEELAERINPETVKRLSEPLPGLIVGAAYDVRQGASFDAYSGRYGATITFEPGRWKSLAERTSQVYFGACTAVRLFEEEY